MTMTVVRVWPRAAFAAPSSSSAMPFDLHGDRAEACGMGGEIDLRQGLVARVLAAGC